MIRLLELIFGYYRGFLQNVSSGELTFMKVMLVAFITAILLTVGSYYYFFNLVFGNDLSLVIPSTLLFTYCVFSMYRFAIITTVINNDNSVRKFSIDMGMLFKNIIIGFMAFLISVPLCLFLYKSTLDNHLAMVRTEMISNLRKGMQPQNNTEISDIIKITEELNRQQIDTEKKLQKTANGLNTATDKIERNSLSIKLEIFENELVTIGAKQDSLAAIKEELLIAFNKGKQDILTKYSSNLSKQQLPLKRIEYYFSAINNKVPIICVCLLFLSVIWFKYVLVYKKSLKYEFIDLSNRRHMIEQEYEILKNDLTSIYRNKHKLDYTYKENYSDAPYSFEKFIYPETNIKPKGTLIEQLKKQ